jgi:hypothetical protein
MNQDDLKRWIKLVEGSLGQLAEGRKDYVERGERLEEIAQEMSMLLGEAESLVRGTPEESRAKSYWVAHIAMALSDDHSYMGRNMSTMAESARELMAYDGSEDDDEEEEINEGDSDYVGTATEGRGIPGVVGTHPEIQLGEILGRAVEDARAGDLAGELIEEEGLLARAGSLSFALFLDAFIEAADLRIQAYESASGQDAKNSVTSANIDGNISDDDLVQYAWGEIMMTVSPGSPAGVNIMQSAIDAGPPIAPSSEVINQLRGAVYDLSSHSRHTYWDLIAVGLYQDYAVESGDITSDELEYMRENYSDLISWVDEVTEGM